MRAVEWRSRQMGYRAIDMGLAMCALKRTPLGSATDVATNMGKVIDAVSYCRTSVDRCETLLVGYLRSRGFTYAAIGSIIHLTPQSVEQRFRLKLANLAFDVSDDGGTFRPVGNPSVPTAQWNESKVDDENVLGSVGDGSDCEVQSIDNNRTDDSWGLYALGKVLDLDLTFWRRMLDERKTDGDSYFPATLFGLLWPVVTVEVDAGAVERICGSVIAETRSLAAYMRETDSGDSTGARVRTSIGHLLEFLTMQRDLLDGIDVAAVAHLRMIGVPIRRIAPLFDLSESGFRLRFSDRVLKHSFAKFVDIVM